MTITVAPGTSADLDLLEPLWRVMFAVHHRLIADRVPFLPPDESWRRRRQKYAEWIEAPGSFLLLARAAADEAPVGYAFCTVEPGGMNSTYDLSPFCGDVESLSVAEGMRGLGIGTALLEAARARFAEQGCGVWTVGMVEDNAGAGALYERLGFRTWERRMVAPLAGGPGAGPGADVGAGPGADEAPDPGSGAGDGKDVPA